MPLYTYRCPDCGSVSTDFNTVADRHKGPDCCSATNLVITPVQIQAQILGGGSLQGYHCPVTNQFVTSRAKRREIMKRHDLVEADSPSSERKTRVIEATNGTGVAN